MITRGNAAASEGPHKPCDAGSSPAPAIKCAELGGFEEYETRMIGPVVWFVGDVVSLDCVD